MVEPIEATPENAAQQVLGEPAVEEPKAEPKTEILPVEEDSRYQKRIDQLTRARREAEERAIRAEERARMMEQQRFAAPSTPAATEDKIGEMTREKWEEWHAENPVDAMRYLSRAEGRAEAEKVKAETMSQIGRASAVQETINDVYKTHPELKEVMEGRKLAEEVPFWQVYDEVAREMPDAKYLVKGPYIVMKEAERRVKEKEMAERERKISGEAALQEKERQEQVGAGHIAGASPRPPSAGSVKLSPDEERVARKMGISPEEYAKYKATVKVMK